MFREQHTEKLIEYIQGLPNREQRFIVKTLSSPKVKSDRKTTHARTEQDVLNGIKRSLQEIKEAKRTGKPMKTLDEFLDEL